MVSEIEEAAEALAARYWNSAHQISNQFVIKLKQASPEVQTLVNTKLISRGLPPYDLEGKKTRKRHRGTPPAHVADSCDVCEIVRALGEVQADKATIQSFLTEVETAEVALQQQLGELRGTPFTGFVDDPYQQSYKPAHDHARHNKEELAASTKCGCFFCRAIFDPIVPMEFVENDTALCPSCGIDAIIGDKAGFELTNEFLLAMFKRWFAIPIRLRAARTITGRMTAAPELECVPDTAPATPVEFTPPPHLVEGDENLFGKGGKLLSSLPEDLGDDASDPDEEYQQIDDGADPVN